MILEHLNVSAEFDPEVAEFWGTNASNNGVGAKGLGDAILPRETVEAARNMAHHLSDHQLRQPLEWKAMSTGA